MLKDHEPGKRSFETYAVCLFLLLPVAQNLADSDRGHDGNWRMGRRILNLIAVQALVTVKLLDSFFLPGQGSVGFILFRHVIRLKLKSIGIIKLKSNRKTKYTKRVFK